MKKLLTPYALGGSVITLASLLIMLAFAGAFRQSMPVYDPAFDAYLSAFSSGEVSKNSSLQVQFARDIVGPEQIEQRLATKLVSLSPSVKGEARWTDSRTLTFFPEKPLSPGKTYVATVDMEEIIPGIPKAQAEFSFPFKVKPRAFNVSLEGGSAVYDQEEKLYSVEGRLLSSDVEEPAEIEALFSAELDGKTCKVLWQHQSANRSHSFRIDSLPREAQAQSLTLRWDGKVLRHGNVDPAAIEIPQRDAFTLVRVLAFRGESPRLVAEFSENLKPGQSLRGLVRLGNEEADFSIEQNKLHIFPRKGIRGAQELRIEAGLEDHNGQQLQTAQSRTVSFDESKPEVKLVGKGVIIPQGATLPFLFQSMALSAVDVRVIRIFEQNVPQFLQVNQLDGENELQRVGRIVAQKTIRLDETGELDLSQWHTHSLDLSSLINVEPGAIYQVALGFRRSYALLGCSSGGDFDDYDMLAMKSGWDSPDEYDRSWWDFWNYMDDEEDYWSRQGDPCHKAYYSRDRVVMRNVLASDLGLLAKQGDDGATLCYVTDLKTTQPLQGVKLELFNLQRQKLAELSTGADGMVRFKPDSKPFLLIASQGKQRGYLRLDDGSSLSLSNFDVSGAAYHKGIKGYLYGERGVWRPGDDIFLTFVLEDKLNTLPAEHPVAMELLNPKGQTVDRIVRKEGLNGFYAFQTRTPADAITGNYIARVSVGGATFSKVLKVETIMPNRLKIKFDLPAGIAGKQAKNLRFPMTVTWLHGAPAPGLRAEVKASLRQSKTAFKGYETYLFDDPSRSFSAEEKVVFDGNLDDKGVASIPFNLNAENNAPGRLEAVINTRVFEPGGNASIDQTQAIFNPYDYYAGIKLPEGDKARGMLLTGTDHVVDVVTLDAGGKPAARSGVKVALYKLDWRWWWDNNDYDQSLAAFQNGEGVQAMAQGTISTTAGKGQWKFRVDEPEWGRFLVLATDPGGHVTGKVIYIDWPGWAGRARGEQLGATMLNFSAEKEHYTNGETVTLNIPTGFAGRALISLEAGNRVLKTEWIPVQQGVTRYSFTTTPEMAPTVYASVSLVQPHAQTVNDMPIRMYGVIPIMVDDPQTRLEPLISMKDQLEPMSEAVIQVSEKRGGPMTYTLAIVDEGLLSLTRFKTPNPHDEFFKRLALTVKTWDVFDHVTGAFGGKISSLLSIGGSEQGIDPSGLKQNRFKPVVHYLGPFNLEAGKSAIHKVSIPNYVGEVRVMVVAGNNGAYGKAEKSVPVKKPLMILATLPRVLGPGESCNLPVTVFAMENTIKKVQLNLEGGTLISPLAGTNQQVDFSSPGDKTVNFGIKVNNQTGTGKVKITATSGDEQAVYYTDIEVRNPNPRSYQASAGIAEGGKNWKKSIAPIGVQGTNHTVLEISSIPPLNLGQRLKYLVQYPYGCLEQTTSSVFPQLYVSRLMDVNDALKARTDGNIRAGIDRLRKFQQSNGGFVYWPGANDINDWSSCYVGHFLIEAERAGYQVPADMMRRWKDYQRQRAKDWNARSNWGDDMTQSYRLMLLALSGSPDMGAMNRMRQGTLSDVVRWNLAAAYHLAGQRDAARKLADGAPTVVYYYRELSGTFGSDLRDESMILYALSLMDRQAEAAPQAQRISALLTSDSWYSTQGTAWALMAMSQFVGAGKTSPGINGAYRFAGGSWINVSSTKSVWQVDLPGDLAGEVELKNNGKSLLYVRVIQDGIPATGDPTESANGLSMAVNYATLGGVPVDVSRIAQGTDFVAKVTIANTGLAPVQNISLDQIFPSGWEIHNHRLSGTNPGGDAADYQDIRDDRVYSFFDLKKGESKTFHILLNASYQGRYYLPPLAASAMYDHSISARRRGQWVEVVGSSGN